ncbi:YiaA/YiaB family inner membrane protein [Dactylosporangium sp. NPDC051484]|uniref:YiaA/YiaB family inner membrane protein n=1 Tax=Dactylosporangium sp. NPDC051484 TaxID=3154942 RepID=UPI00344E0760
MSANIPRKTTPAFLIQSALSFVVSIVGVRIGIAYLPVNAWMRAFLGLGLLYTVTSAFTLAKVIRDQQESVSVVQRVDQARLDRILTEHDPFRAAP